LKTMNKNAVKLISIILNLFRTIKIT